MQLVPTCPKDAKILKHGEAEEDSNKALMILVVDPCREWRDQPGGYRSVKCFPHSIGIGR